MNLMMLQDHSFTQSLKLLMLSLTLHSIADLLTLHSTGNNTNNESINSAMLQHPTCYLLNATNKYSRSLTNHQLSLEQ